ncbi:uncharacterized protein PAC_12295 [Phialocephala subalpina]|uniref:Uncharacterized protein n=1 Tax=Phialocephala subalpina TaxID=576137 RepID=A0A1L7XBJ1_9HELO|nr:uncharacterized protein PAC_12295 [Phialocephala subalpina]
MSSTPLPSVSATPSSCAYGYCGSSCLETSISICCTGSGSGNSSGTVQCGNGWFCSNTPGQCCHTANQEYCSGAGLCFDTAAGQSCCGPTVCPQNQTCASSGDRCCPKSQTVCATDWWLIPVSTSVTVISLTTTPTSHLTTTSITSSSVTSTGASMPSSGGLSSGAKGGIAVGSILGIAAIVGLVLLLLRSRKRNAHDNGTNPIYVTTQANDHDTDMTPAGDNNAWHNVPSSSDPSGQHELAVPPEYDNEAMNHVTYTPYRPPSMPTIPR